MKLTVIEPFSWAHGGIHVQVYQPGETIETDDADLVEVAQREGWAADASGAGTKAVRAAPENKASKPPKQK